jgi:zinc/manganese transport system substrate-binding protein
MVRMHSRSALFTLAVTLFTGLPGGAQAAVNVFTCEPEWAALAQELGGDRLDIYSATTALQDPHHIQARPSLIAKARKADLLICTGAELEVGWLPLLLRKAGNARIQPGQPGHFITSGFVELLEKPEKLDRSLGDIHASGNPHIHTDPHNIAVIAVKLQQRLVELDPAHAEIYTNRYATFKRKWQHAVDAWRKQARPVSGVDVIVHHDYWSYLIRWLELKKVATLEPVPGVAPSTRHLSQIKQMLNQYRVSMIIDTNYMNDKPVQWLAKQTDIAVVTLPATVDYQGGETLYQWFDNVTGLLAGAVQ